MADEPETTIPGAAANGPQTTAIAGNAQAIPAPEADITDAHANESEYERIQRLKLNTDDAPHSGAIDQDIAKILQEVKLPERSSFKAAADMKPAPVAPVETVHEPESAPTPQKPKERDPVTALHTLKDDVQDVVRERKISLVRASALEQDKKRFDTKEYIPNPGAVARRRRIFAIIFASLLLVALGGAAIYGVALVSEKRSQTPVQQYPSLLFAEQTETLAIDNLTPDALKEEIAQARAQNQAPLGSITRIVPTLSTPDAQGNLVAQPATTQQFLTALGVQAPQSLLRGLASNFFFGIHTVDINAPVLVIPVTDYDLAFAGMLAWESTMNQDLAPAFDAVPALTTGPNGLPIERTFSDSVMLNYDVRVLKDDSGNIVLYYSFPTPSILVIAESPSTFSEVLSRLEAQGEL